MTIEIGYYADDSDLFFEDDPDEIRERAFTSWRKHAARCDAGTLRLAREYAHDLGFHADVRRIGDVLRSRGRS